jgi:hypothetical protein
MAETPERGTVVQHAAIIGLTAELLNVTATYLDAPNDTEQETLAEEALADHLRIMVALGDDPVSNILLALASLIVAVAPEDEVQAWFTNQAERIQEALDS